MRIISQNGNVDLPYEKFVFGITKDNKIACCRECVAPPYEIYNGIIAEYSSKEKAIKAMEMLREAYIGMPIVMQNVDVSEDVVKEFERLKKCGIVVQTENQPSKIECISNSIFQFPTEEELE